MTTKSENAAPRAPEPGGPHLRAAAGAGTGASFWKSGAGRALIAALVLGGALLAYENRAALLAGGGLLLLPLLLCLGMHFFMHRGHGGHRGGPGDG